MKYQEAIEGARKYAKNTQRNCVVFSYKNHWWHRTKFDYDILTVFKACQYPTAVKLLTITPDGTIAQ